MGKFNQKQFEPMNPAPGSDGQDVLIEASKPEGGDLAPMYFYVVLLSLFGVPLLFINMVAGLALLLGALIVYLYFYTRMSSPYEAIKLIGGHLQVIRGRRAIWTGRVNDIQSVDIDTFSEFNAERGMTMVVFYLKNGDSWSFSYVNYQHKQLKMLKALVESVSNKSE
ncbi:hypothetical protein ACQUQU_17445 [Thalassolituus sp. LLYu03]|uniref:hypothetical protein n=1 Tax=Thalassolituus sp. LLYu03 TaxID=3421656 RepID=UPI003D2D0F19